MKSKSGNVVAWTDYASPEMDCWVRIRQFHGSYRCTSDLGGDDELDALLRKVGMSWMQKAYPSVWDDFEEFLERKKMPWWKRLLTGTR